MLKNLTKNQTIAKHIIECKSILEKSMGLIFTSKRKMSGKALIFYFDKEQIIPIHMMYVFYSVDVIWLDKNKRVVELKTLLPFTAYSPKAKAMYVIEADEGIIKKTNTEKGDLFEWVE